MSKEDTFGQELAKARDEWMEKHKAATDVRTLGTKHPNYFLSNRLQLAFIDGANWANNRKKTKS